MTAQRNTDSLLTPLCGGNEQRGPQREVPESPARMVAQFHRWAYQEEFGAGVDDPSLRITLHKEEDKELLDALEDSDAPTLLAYLVAVAKELADKVYIAYGTAHSLGIPLDDVVRLVHESNMSKGDDYGNAVLRDDNKVLKGPYYEPPEDRIAALIYALLAEKTAQEMRKS
jgi:hypothetical protein